MLWSMSNESTQAEGAHYERRIETHYPRPFEIGVAAGGAIFCAAVLGVSLFADSSFIRFAELAQQAVK
jgi:hypothetical protein